MRLGLGLIIIAGLFCAYWFGVAHVVRNAPSQLAAQGVRMQELDVSGFPASFTLDIGRPALPAQGWSAQAAQLRLPAYWPFTATGHVSGPHDISALGALWRLHGQDMPFAWALSPSLTVKSAMIRAPELAITGPTTATLQSARLALDPGTSVQDYSLLLDFDKLTLTPLEHALQQGHLRADLQFVSPLQPTGRQTPQAITLKAASVRMGPTDISATGALNRRADGLWDGAITLVVANWQPLLPALQALGLLSADQAPMVMMMIQSMRANDPLTLPLTVTGSILSLGPLAVLDFSRF